MAVKRAPNGQMVEWFDEKNGAMGYIKILITHPTSGGYCRQAETKVRLMETKELGFTRLVLLTKEHPILKPDNILIDFYPKPIYFNL